MRHEYHHDDKDWHKGLTEPPGTAERRTTMRDILKENRAKYKVLHEQWQDKTYIIDGHKMTCSKFKENFIGHIRHAISIVNLIEQARLFPVYKTDGEKDFYETKLQLLENDHRDCLDNNGCLPGETCVVSGGKKGEERPTKENTNQKRKIYQTSIVNETA